METKDTKKNRGILRRNTQLNEMSKNVKVKTRKVRKIKRKYEITSINKIPIMKENLLQKN